MMSSKLFAVVKMIRNAAQLYDAKIKGNLPEIIFKACQNITANTTHYKLACNPLMLVHAGRDGTNEWEQRKKHWF